jgi:hypothetical protein
MGSKSATKCTKGLASFAAVRRRRPARGARGFRSPRHTVLGRSSDRSPGRRLKGAQTVARVLQHRPAALERSQGWCSAGDSSDRAVSFSCPRVFLLACTRGNSDGGGSRGGGNDNGTPLGRLGARDGPSQRGDKGEPESPRSLCCWAAKCTLPLPAKAVCCQKGLPGTQCDRVTAHDIISNKEACSPRTRCSPPKPTTPQPASFTAAKPGRRPRTCCAGRRPGRPSRHNLVVCTGPPRSGRPPTRQRQEAHRRRASAIARAQPSPLGTAARRGRGRAAARGPSPEVGPKCVA